jgi:hypothetical protein
MRYKEIRCGNGLVMHQITMTYVFYLQRFYDFFPSHGWHLNCRAQEWMATVDHGVQDAQRVFARSYDHDEAPDWPIEVHFESKERAMQFKLTWGGSQ